MEVIGTTDVGVVDGRLLRGAGAGLALQPILQNGLERRVTLMTLKRFGQSLQTKQMVRRFLLHVLPRGFHRIRHYGLLAGSSRKTSIARARELLNAAPPPADDAVDEPIDIRPPCPCCGGRMIVIEVFKRWRQPREPPDKPATNRESAS